MNCSVAMQSGGSSETGYVESKPTSVVQSAQQQSLMSPVYLPPISNYLYHSDRDDDDDDDEGDQQVNYT